jgi:hypothetical protein
MSAIAATGRPVEPVRMVCIGLEYSIHPEGFFPKETGRNYATPGFGMETDQFATSSGTLEGLS